MKDVLGVSVQFMWSDRALNSAKPDLGKTSVSDKEINRTYAKMSDGTLRDRNSFILHFVPDYQSTPITRIDNYRLLESFAHFRQDGIATASFGLVQMSDIREHCR